jgi:hypothetical protein
LHPLIDACKTVRYYRPGTFHKFGFLKAAELGIPRKLAGLLSTCARARISSFGNYLMRRGCVYERCRVTKDVTGGSMEEEMHGDELQEASRSRND